MDEFQDAFTYPPAPEVLAPPGENSEEGPPKKHQKERPFKIDYVPLAGGAYAELPLVMAPTLEFGGNFFSQTLQSGDRRLLYRALLQRCHGDEQLRQNRFVFLGPPARDVKLPLGVRLDDFVAAPPPDPRRPPKRWAVAIDCEMVGVAPTPQEQAAHMEKKAGKDGRGKAAVPAPAGRGRAGSLSSSAQLGRGRGGTAAATKPTAPQETRKPPKPLFERSELAQLCAVDALTGEVLVDVLVQPRGRVVNWRTRYSGVTRQVLEEAKSQGTCVTGWEEARSLLLDHIDASTILVGHSLDNDLPMLRLSHTRIVDTALQTSEAVYGAVNRFPRVWGLSDLLQELAGLTVQNHGRRGHSCLEDTLATRELALWCLRFPRRLEAWGRNQRHRLEAQAVEREAERQKRAAAEKKKGAQAEGAKAEKGKNEAVSELVAAGAKLVAQDANDKTKKRVRRKPKPRYGH